MKGALNVNALWTSEEAMHATGGISLINWSVHGVSIDSRTIKPGDLFIALKGPNFDGHNYVDSALNTCSAAIVEQIDEKVNPDSIPLLLVPDSYKALNDLAKEARTRNNGKVIGITGSVGKTGTKELLLCALESGESVTASDGNLNNHIGVPLSLARLQKDTKFSIFELGMSKAGELTNLSKLVRPHIVIITNIEAVHTEFFENVDGIAKAKSEIFAGLEVPSTAILNRDDRYFDFLTTQLKGKEPTRVISFGENTNANALLLDYCLEESGSTVRAKIFGQEYRYRLALKGKQWAINSLAVLCAADAAGIPINEAAAELCRARPLMGRGEQHEISTKKGKLRLIDESYNASPVSMHAAITLLGKLDPEGTNRRICVLGDMLELGQNEIKFHTELLDTIIASNIEMVCTVGPLMSHLYDVLPPHLRGFHSMSSKEMLPLVSKALQPNDIILIKGSFGLAMRHLVLGLRHLSIDKTSNEEAKSNAI